MKNYKKSGMKIKIDVSNQEKKGKSLFQKTARMNLKEATTKETTPRDERNILIGSR
jgi:hypothetical protein